ncbi:MAG: hypothetical protein U0704_12045 [Candidatus Eisenbacteria bacterium]
MPLHEQVGRGRDRGAARHQRARRGVRIERRVVARQPQCVEAQVERTRVGAERCDARHAGVLEQRARACITCRAGCGRVRERAAARREHEHLAGHERRARPQRAQEARVRARGGERGRNGAERQQGGDRQERSAHGKSLRGGSGGSQDKSRGERDGTPIARPRPCEMHARRL